MSTFQVTMLGKGGIQLL